jgi:hypothetical protein
MFLERQMPGFFKKGEKSPGIRAWKAPRGANSKNLRMNSRPWTTPWKACRKNHKGRTVRRMRLLRISFARRGKYVVWKALLGTPYPEVRRCARAGAAAVRPGEGAASRSHGGRARRRCAPWIAPWPAMEFQSYYGSSYLLGNSIAAQRICGGSALGAWSDTTH